MICESPDAKTQHSSFVILIDYYMVIIIGDNFLFVRLKIISSYIILFRTYFNTKWTFMENNKRQFSLLGCKGPRNGLSDGCRCLRLGCGFGPWRWLWGLGLFDSRSRHHLCRSGGKATGSRPALQHYTKSSKVAESNRNN